METFTHIVKDPAGVHARPAGAVIKTAGACRSAVFLSAKGRRIALKGGIFALLSLGIRQGEELTLEIEGEDEAESARKMKAACEQYL